MHPTFGYYEDLHRCLAGIINFGGNEREYDLVGITMLALALLDNLRMHAILSDVEAVCDCMTPDQASYIIKLAGNLRLRARKDSD